ncbi:MAG: YegP family protein, partial [Kineosporiaceae bacterium]
SYYWRAVADNGRVLASSETYYNKSDAQAAINTVKREAATAQTVDLTRSAARRY